MYIFSSAGASVFAWGVFDRGLCLQETPQQKRCFCGFLRIAWGLCLGVSADFCGFLVARDISGKTLTSINESRNQNRKLNSPEENRGFT